MTGKWDKNNPSYPMMGLSFTDAHQSAQRSIDRP